MKFLALLLNIFILFSLPTLASEKDPGHNERMAVHLLDYLAKDYEMAVGEEKIVLSKDEYQEQKDFAEELLRISESLSPWPGKAAFLTGIQSLKKNIEQKESPRIVREKARDLQKQTMALARFQNLPRQSPDLLLAEKIYAKDCASCHGEKGGGDGPLGKNLEPKPVNFLDNDYMSAVTPFQEFNTIRLGVPGTGMMAFNHFSDDEVWALAYYVIGLRAKHQSTEAPPQQITQMGAELSQMLANTSDNQLGEGQLFGQKLSRAQIAYLRLGSFEKGQDSTEIKLALMARLLDQARQNATDGLWNDSKQFTVKAYLDGFEPLEPKIKANDPNLVADMEKIFAEMRLSLNNKNLNLFHTYHAKALTKMSEVKVLLAEAPSSTSVTAALVFTIIFREGLEALLIVLIILGLIKESGSLGNRASRWIHLGWMSALGIGILLWFFSGAMESISGLQREVFEGISSLIAVAILLYVGFWLHQHSTQSAWQNKIKTQIRELIAGNKIYGLFFLSFIAVFREVLETVLFIRTAVPAGSESLLGLSIGFILSGLALTLCAWLILRAQKRLPLVQFFKFSTWLIFALCLVLVGQGLHSLQEAGWVGVHPLGSLRIDALGIFPTRETIWAQGILLLGLIGLNYFLGRKRARAALP